MSTRWRGGGYLRGMHINWGFLSGGLQFGVFFSGGLISRGYSARTLSISNILDEKALGRAHTSDKQKLLTGVLDLAYSVVILVISAYTFVMCKIKGYLRTYLFTYLPYLVYLRYGPFPVCDQLFIYRLKSHPVENFYQRQRNNKQYDPTIILCSQSNSQLIVPFTLLKPPYSLSIMTWSVL